MAKDEVEVREKKPGDPIKSYTIVMGLLVIVMAVIWWTIDSSRAEYQEATERLEQVSLGKRGLSFPELADKVERLATSYQKATAGGTLERHIPEDYMATRAAMSGLMMKTSGPEQPARSQKYETITRRFDYMSSTGGNPYVWQLLALAYNVESTGRYRVSKLEWQLADKQEQPPYAEIRNASVTVALRGPLQ